MNSARNAGVKTVLVAMAAALLASAATVPPAHADKVQDAVNVLKTMTAKQIRAEIRRRAQARRVLRNATPAPAMPPRAEEVPESTARTFQNVEPLAEYDDSTFSDAVAAHTRAIYGGTDDRLEWYQVKDEKIRRLAGATVAIFKGEDTVASATSVQLKTKSLGEVMKLCPDQAFSTQTSGAMCSGTLVRDDVVLTAGHCVGEKNNGAPMTAQLRFVFGYRLEQPNELGPSQVPAGNVFQGKTLLDAELDPKTKRDWALVKLDHPVPASVAEPVKMWGKTPLTKGDKLYVIGYPSGLPMKYAGNASVLNANSIYYVADLDTFGGNSGSGVFSETTNELVGVLVRGETDYVRKNGCNVVYPCTEECAGEDVTRIDLVRMR